MKIPFTKAHGAKNDFLLTWESEIPSEDLPGVAAAICDRHTGAGADGWLVVSPGTDGCHGKIRLFNPDGSEPEISGNGTRCAAAFLIEAGLAESAVTILTGAGPKEIRLLERKGCRYRFEMNMGRAVVEELRGTLLDLSVTIVNVGNPQCAVFVDDFSLDWRALGARLESHPRFPKKTNVSFVKVVDGHTVDVRFFERGVGETMSSGTGSTGAAAAALARGEVTNPVKIETPAGSLNLRVESDNLFLVGPVEIVVKGEFFL
ncbi:MAG: diaminopimelate epimerase [Bryobacteraceae bacterium]